MTTDVETLFRFLLNSSACMHPVYNMPQLNVKQWLPQIPFKNKYLVNAVKLSKEIYFLKFHECFERARANSKTQHVNSQSAKVFTIMKP